jgi:hypothetical protein
MRFQLELGIAGTVCTIDPLGGPVDIDDVDAQEDRIEDEADFDEECSQQHQADYHENRPSPLLSDVCLT